MVVVVCPVPVPPEDFATVPIAVTLPSTVELSGRVTVAVMPTLTRFCLATSRAMSTSRVVPV